MPFSELMNLFREILHYVAEITVLALELIGILIIIIGSVKAIAKVVSQLKNKEHVNIMIDLGRALALALEFKMGAEIVNTVIIRDLKELIILAMVIALRAILAILIHWEMRNERNEEKTASEHTEDTKKAAE
jgi:uncharacterized membrane protein